MNDKDYEARAQAHIAAIKKSSKAMVEDAAVRAVHKVMAEFEERTWVGLTDEEMQAVVDAQPLVSSINVYFKAIEAKLKEKNT